MHGLTRVSPGVAAHFAVQSGTIGGTEGIIYIIPRSLVAGKRLPRQLNALLYEFEVPLDIPPLDIPKFSIQTVTASQARSILRESGYNVPYSIGYDMTPVLELAPKMTAEQRAAFLKAVGL